MTGGPGPKGGGAPAEALIVVDLQRGFVEGAAAVPHANALVERISVLLAGARAAGALVVHLQNDGRPGEPDEPETTGWALHVPVVAGADEVVVRKRADDGFAGTALGQLIADRAVTRVVVAGLLSEMCVSATARSALAQGLHVVLPRDAHGSHDLGDIPAATVARVAEHALGDDVELPDSVDRVAFTAPPR